MIDIPPPPLNTHYYYTIYTDCIYGIIEESKLIKPTKGELRRSVSAAQSYLRQLLGQNPSTAKFPNPRRFFSRASQDMTRVGKLKEKLQEV
jgi:hypothetical protein